MLLEKSAHKIVNVALVDIFRRDDLNRLLCLSVRYVSAFMLRARNVLRYKYFSNKNVWRITDSLMS